MLNIMQSGLGHLRTVEASWTFDDWSYGLVDFKVINVRVLIVGPLRVSWS